MNVSKVIFFLLTAFYSVLFLNCGKKEDKTMSLLMKKEKNYTEAVRNLMEKNNSNLLVDSSAVLTDELKTRIVKSHSVVLDSVVRSVSEHGEDFVLSVEVQTDKAQKVFASLKCSRKIKEQLDDLEHTNVLIAANIDRIDKLKNQYLSQDNDLGNEVLFNREQLILYGSCCEIIKKPTIHDFEREGSRG